MSPLGGAMPGAGRERVPSRSDPGAGEGAGPLLMEQILGWAGGRIQGLGGGGVGPRAGRAKRPVEQIQGRGGKGAGHLLVKQIQGRGGDGMSLQWANLHNVTKWPLYLDQFQNLLRTVSLKFPSEVSKDKKNCPLIVAFRCSQQERLP